MDHLQFHHVCIQTDCYKESLEFYCNLLNMKIVEETAGFHGRAYNTWLKNDCLMIELQTPKAGNQFEKIDQNHQGIAHMCFWVQDIDSFCKEIEEKGITTFCLHDGKKVYEVNSGKLLKLNAPEGTVIEFRDKHDC